MSLADEIVTRLVAAVPPDVAVFDVAVPGIPPARYVVVYCNTGTRSIATIDGLSRDQNFTVQITSVVSLPGSVSSAAPSCRWLAEKVGESLTDWRPELDGFTFGQVVHESSRQPTVDESIPDRPLVFAVDQFSVYADRLIDF